MKKNKIIFINRYFYPDHSATSQLLSDLAFYLTEHNENVTVVTSRQIYNKATSQLPCEEVINNVRIIRVTTSRFGRQNLWGRALDYLTFHLSAAYHLARILDKNDIVIAKTDPPMISVVSAIITKIKGGKLINWLQDLFPEVASALKIKGFSFISPLLKALRNFSLREAKINVVLADKMANKVATLGINPANIKVIDNWADGKLITPINQENNKLRKQWSLENKFVIGYSGNMGRAHEFQTIIDAAVLLKDQTNISFLFIGGGAQHKLLEKKVKDHGLDNFIFKAYQPREELALSLSLPDIHLISLTPSLEGLIVPSKFYGIAAAGRATLYIGDSRGAVPTILKNNNCGITIDIGASEKLSSTILELSKNKPEIIKMGKNARTAFNSLFDKEISLKKWHEVIKLLNIY